jgi:hypothetical protein
MIGPTVLQSTLYTRAADEVRAGDQFEDRKANRTDDSAEGAGESGQGNQIAFWIFDFRFWIET